MRTRVINCLFKYHKPIKYHNTQYEAITRRKHFLFVFPYTPCMQYKFGLTKSLVYSYSPLLLRGVRAENKSSRRENYGCLSIATSPFRNLRERINQGRCNLSFAAMLLSYFAIMRACQSLAQEISSVGGKFRAVYKASI